MALEKRAGIPFHLGEIWEELKDTVSTRIGPQGLEAFCGQVYRLRAAEKRITEEGLVVQDSKGNPIPHPALAIEKQAQTEIRNWIDKYGKTV